MGALVILALIAGACTLFVSIYLIITSPVPLAELLVDGALLGVMTKTISAPRWSRGVLHRAWLSATITAIVFGLVGFGIERVVPGSRAFGEAWRTARARR